MIMWAVKKYVIGKVNKVLDQYKDNVDKMRDTLTVWIVRLEKVLSCFKGLLAKLDDGKLDNEEVDETIKYSGELKILEKAIKDYYNDYFSYKDIVDETRSDALANLLTPEYLNDNRKKLKNVKKEFVEKNKEFIENIDKMIEMFDEEKILSYLDSSKVSNHNYELYKELMIIPSDKEVLENIKTFKENNQEKQDYLYQLIDVLINSSSSWYVKDDNLYIESNSTLKKYNELRVRIYNLDKSKEV